MHPLSAETSHKRLESPFKPSSPYTLMESNTEGERELNLGEFMDIKLIGMAIEYERGGIHHLARIRTLCSNAGFTDIRIRKIPGAGMDFHVCLRP